MYSKLADTLARWGRLYQEAYEAPFRRQQLRARQRREDLFRLLVLSESLGLPNPGQYHALELLPFVLNDFHAWHRRMGMEHSPLEGFRCC